MIPTKPLSFQSIASLPQLQRRFETALWLRLMLMSAQSKPFPSIIYKPQPIPLRRLPNASAFHKTAIDQHVSLCYATSGLSVATSGFIAEGCGFNQAARPQREKEKALGNP